MRSHKNLNYALIFLTALIASPASAAGTLRVCSDPNNLPFSNRAGEGFENKIAAMIAHDLKKEVVYTWAMENDRFVRNTLNKHQCDVIVGVPAGLDEVETTKPYYTSTYVFISRADRNLNLTSLKDPRLHKLTIGVHLIGDDAVPPAIALGEEGVVDNVRGYMIYGDMAKPNPPSRLIEAVADGEVDVAAAWGPLGGYFAKREKTPLAVTPISGTQGFAPLVFRYSVAMGVRKGNDALKQQLDAALARNKDAIRRVLVSYGVPLVKEQADDHQ
jgi:quinoprotein dehydrogenase-associated probable ABC transporter substrate-binding protein